MALYSYLEERTAVTIEKATSRLQDGDRRLKIADEKILDLEKALRESQVPLTIDVFCSVSYSCYDVIEERERWIAVGRAVVGSKERWRNVQ